MVDAVPGAGKTTTVLCMAREMPGTAMTVVTYNKAIKLEMRARAATVGLGNLDIHTYHSLARKYYDKKCADDGAISRILGEDAPLLPGAGRRPSVLVVDECQDMTPQYCRLVKKFVRDTAGERRGEPGGERRGEPVLCFLGDTMQSVYGFKRADPRFLSMAAGVFGVAAEPLRLASTYRLTKPVARFINAGLLGRDRISAAKGGAPVEMMAGHPYRDCVPWIFGRITRLLRQGAYRPEDFFVVCCSLKSANAPYKVLENKLAVAGVPCHFPSSEDSELTPELIEGKVVFTTIHQAKGREREVVAALGVFDSGFYSCFRTARRDACTELHFVAASRAKSLLLVAVSSEEEPLAFADFGPLVADGTVVLAGGPYRRGFPKSERGPRDGADSRPACVTALTRHISSEDQAVLEDLLAGCFEQERPPSYSLGLPSLAPARGGLVYDVPHINGIAICAMWERLSAGGGGVTIARQVRERYRRGGLPPVVAGAVRALPEALSTPEDFLRAAVIFEAIADGVLSRICGLESYDWLDGADLSPAMQAVQVAVSDALDEAGGIPQEPPTGRGGGTPQERLSFEVPVSGPPVRCADGKTRHASGRLDASLGPACGFEIKCVSEITFEHRLQALVYASISRREEFRLLNMATGERLRVVRRYIPGDLVERLMDVKYRSQPEVPDEDFVAAHSRPYEKFRGPRTHPRGGAPWPFIQPK